jgi:hypothetical protein
MSSVSSEPRLVVGSVKLLQSKVFKVWETDLWEKLWLTLTCIARGFEGHSSHQPTACPLDLARSLLLDSTLGTNVS